MTRLLLSIRHHPSLSYWLLVAAALVVLALAVWVGPARGQVNIEADQGLLTLTTESSVTLTTDLFETPPDEVTRVELRDGLLYVYRIGGEYCGGGCLVYGHTQEDHCLPYREVYGAVDGEVTLLRTERPEIVPATERRVIWPEDEEGGA